MHFHSSTPPARPSSVHLHALETLVGHLGSGLWAPALPESLVAALPDALVRRHFLAPMAYQAGIARFRMDFIANALLAEVRAKILAEAVDALAMRRVPVMLFKGISYVGALYPEPAERPMSDIDLMVRPEQFADAAKVLQRLGYWAAGPPRQGSRLHHAQTFKRRDAAVDLHRSVMQPWRSRIDLEAIWNRAQPVREQPGALRPSPLDETVLHLAHVARHELRVPAINYVDAARLIARVEGEPVAQVLERACRYRMQRGVAAALAMTGALTGISVASPAARLAPFRLGCVLPSAHEVLADLPLGRARQILRKLILLDGPRELAGLLLVAAHGRLAGHRRA